MSSVRRFLSEKREQAKRRNVAFCGDGWDVEVKKVVVKFEC